MRYYTKEWSRLLDEIGVIEDYKSVPDHEGPYTEEEINALYREAMISYIAEEHLAYDEPPFMVFDLEEEIPESTQEELDREMKEFEKRPPFDEEEAKSDFEESYRDYLEDPDEDLPEWVRSQVDPRLLAMGLIPESIYKKLEEEDKVNQKRFDELDDIADEALDKVYESLPEEYKKIADELDELDGDYVISAAKEGDSFVVRLAGWDDEGDEVKRRIVFESPEILEDEGLSITTEIDEDGDTVTDCDLLYHELYLEDGRPEVHMLFDNNGEKYITLRCKAIRFEQEPRS